MWSLAKAREQAVVAKKLSSFGLTATKEQVAEITARIKRESSLRKWTISDDVIEIIAKDVLEGK